MKPTGDWIAYLRSTGAKLYSVLPHVRYFSNLLRSSPEHDMLCLRWEPIPEKCWAITAALRRDGWAVSAALRNNDGDFLVGATRPKPKVPIDGQADLERFTDRSGMTTESP